MSDITNNEDGIAFKIFRQENCRIAYTLSGDQPVRCSIIGDEPLFFMDFDEIFEEEEHFEDALFMESAELGLAEIRAKISVADKFSSEVSGISGEKLESFISEGISVTEEQFRARAKDKELETIRELKETLLKSRLATELFEFAKKHKVGFCCTRQVETAIYDRNSEKIIINPELDASEKVLLAARELRRVWQHKNGALINPLIFHPDQSVLVNRAQIADVNVAMVRIAWELQLAGKSEAWERIENSSMADLAYSFARESYLDFRSLNNGVASCAAFETWFLSERCKFEDRKLIQQMLADYNGYVFDGAETSRNVTAELIAALGSVPFGKNYLAPFVETIINDALFTDVRDRSNANFLWFIKFERSFRETEQELHGNMEAVSGDDNSNKRKMSDEDKEAAEIISLLRDEKGLDTEDEKGGRSVSSNVVNFQLRKK
jgi:hypothetical protein